MSGTGQAHAAIIAESDRTTLSGGAVLKPVAYTIRVHPRARHVRLRVDPRHGLVVTVPKRFDTRRVASLVAERKPWIDAVQARMEQARSALDEACRGPRPTRIELSALGEQRRVTYQPASRSSLGFHAGPDELTFKLPDLPAQTLDERIAARLRTWLLETARSHLPGVVRELAAEHGFRHGRIQFRNQRARWGSCSANGNLSLNARLLFATPEACRYVLIHELVHTEHLNHSSAFWDRVAQIMPDYQDHQRKLKTTWHQLPDWIQ